MPDLCKLTLCDLATGVREKRFSAADVVKAHTARIDALEPRVKAWVTLDLDRALERAASLDAAGPTGPLAGVPIAVKDIIDVAGLPTRCGSPIYDAAPAAQRSAACVSALEAAGAIVLGKSVTTEFAYYTPRKTRNPWNLAHTPGGSSMGSAAAVACGMAAAALGTQTNGSVIRPAAFCGVVGFKPSFGAVSNDGILDPWPTLDHTGVFARDVADAATLASIIVEPGLLGGGPVEPERPPRLALVRSPVWVQASEAQRELLAHNADALERAGAQVEALELPAPFERAHALMRTIMAYEAARHFAALQRQHREALSAQFNALLDEGAAVAENAYHDAVASAAALKAEFAAAYAQFDAVITPPTPGEAPATLSQTGSPAFCTIWTLLGAPAITIPVGLGPAGMPLGLQIVGRHRDDERVLGVAAWCEARLGRAVRTPVDV
jgi:Asp-tRNA(Asn)/Glu-tRNA(Gln) amidotransferase A subunit family amidase